MESLVAPSGSEKRIATCAIDCAIVCNCWPRADRFAMKKNIRIGAENSAINPAKASKPPLPCPIAAWIEGQKLMVSSAPAMVQMPVASAGSR